MIFETSVFSKLDVATDHDEHRARSFYSRRDDLEWSDCREQSAEDTRTSARHGPGC